MKIFIYNSIFLILLPFIVARIFIKSFKDIAYIENIHNRFGIYNEKSKKNLIWFHAVSLGEVISSKTIIKNIITKNKVVLTVSTPTGLREARRIYKDSLIIVYAPWDFIFFVKGFIRKFNPVALILFETEIWPSMIYLASKRNIPIILSNARLSKESFNNYFRMRFFMKDFFKKFSLVLAQYDKHIKYFKKIGIEENKIIKIGSVKFDINVNQKTLADNHQHLTNFILAASTHKGEDEIVIKAFSKLKKDFLDLKLVIVPRHPERSNEILRILKKYKISSEKLSNIPMNHSRTEAFVINATGLLNSFYKLANISFVGGSLISKYGGHNIIEPASNNCAFIVGPFMKNFNEVLILFKQKDACIQLNDPNELSNAFKELLENNELRANMVDNAIKTIDENKGSSKKQFIYIDNLINNEVNNSNN